VTPMESKDSSPLSKISASKSTCTPHQIKGQWGKRQ
jgi:hypothetical protein